MVAAVPPAAAGDAAAAPNVKIEVRDLGIRYGHATVLDKVNLQIREHEIFGIIGPANAGKTSFLKALNRMDMFTCGIRNKADLDIIVERCLARAALWDEVKDRLNSLGSLLSGGQQQRLTIARALSQEPEVLMLDEFSIAVDPVTTMRIEDVLKELRREMTIILVTNLVQQARRLAQRTAFFLNGACVEIGETEALFSGEVRDSRTRDYVEGRFG